MKKTHYILLFLLILSVFLFAAERRLIVPSRFSDFLKLSADQIHKQSQAIDFSIEKKQLNGELKKFFVTADIPAEKLNSVAASHALIQGVGVYNTHGVLLAENNFSPLSLPEWTSKVEKKNQGQSIFYKNHWYKFYPVWEEQKKLLGFFVLELSLSQDFFSQEFFENGPGENNFADKSFFEKIIFLSDVSKNNLILSTNSFSPLGKSHLLKIVQESSFASAKYAARKIDGQNYDVYLSPLYQNGGKIGLAVLSAPIFSYTTFYLTLLSLFAFLFSLLVHPALSHISQKRKVKKEKRERVEEILRVQKETLAELKNQMQHFQEVKVDDDEKNDLQKVGRDNFFEASVIEKYEPAKQNIFSHEPEKLHEELSPWDTSSLQTEIVAAPMSVAKSEVIKENLEVAFLPKPEPLENFISRDEATQAKPQYNVNVEKQEINPAFIIEEDSFDEVIFLDPFEKEYGEKEILPSFDNSLRAEPVELKSIFPRHDEKEASIVFNKKIDAMFGDNFVRERKKNKPAEPTENMLEKEMELPPAATAVLPESSNPNVYEEEEDDLITFIGDDDDEFITEDTSENMLEKKSDLPLPTQDEVAEIKPERKVEPDESSYTQKLLEQRLQKEKIQEAHSVQDALSQEPEKENVTQDNLVFETQEPQKNLEEQNVFAGEKSEDVLEIEEKPNSVLREEIRSKQVELKKDLNNRLSLSQSDAVSREPVPEAVEKIRQRVFSKDNQRIFEEVSTNQIGADKKNILAKIEKFCQEPPTHQHGSFFDKMSEVYFKIGKEKSNDDMLPLFDYWQEVLAADGLIYLPYNASLQCYRSAYAHNMPKMDSKNFYFLNSDFILDTGKKHYKYFPIDNVTKQNIYFYKKFPFEALSKLQGIYTVSLKQFGLNSYLLALYYREADELVTSFSEQELNLQLRQMVPALKLSLEENNNGAFSLNSLETTGKEFRLLSNRGEEQVKSFHCQTTSRIDMDMWQQLKNSMSDFLGEDERMIYLSPNHLLFFLKKSKKSDVVKKIENLILNLKTESYQFPQDGKNIYLYI